MNQSGIYKGLEYTTKEINGTFKIKVSGVNYEGNRLNIAVGVSGLIKLIGVDLSNNLLKRAFETKDDKCICKLRRGLKITFYFH